MLKLSATEPGYIVSGLAHGAVLLVALVAFSDAPKMPDAQETVPIEVLSDQQFNEITKGEKTEKKVAPTPTKPDQVADIVEPKPTPVKQPAKVDIPTPPPPLKRIPDPSEDDDEEPSKPTPPQRVAALPPPRPQPEPPKIEPPKPQPRPDPPKAEAIEPPKPPERPKPEAKPPPPVPPKQEAKPAPPTPPKPKTDDKAKNDQLAKLIDQKLAQDSSKPAARPRSGAESNETRRFEPGAIANALSREPAQQRAATGRALSQTASIGAPNANAPRMSPSMWGSLDGYMKEQYKQCWTFLGLAGGQKYVPQIKVTFSEHGGLVGAPELLNKPSDPAMSSLAESAMRAVKKCDPLRIPAQYAPFYNEWKARILRFDPEEMSG